MTKIELVNRWDGFTTDIFDESENYIGQFKKTDERIISKGIVKGNSYWFITSDECGKVEHVLDGALDSARAVAIEFEKYNFGKMFDENEIEFFEHFANPCSNIGAFEYMKRMRGSELDAAIDIAFEYERENLIYDACAWKSYLKGLVENA